MRRRKYIALSGAAFTSVLAGCGGGTEDGGDRQEQTQTPEESTETATPTPDEPETEEADSPVVIESLSISNESAQDLSLPVPTERTTAIVVDVEYAATDIDEFELTARLRVSETVHTEVTATVTASDEPPYRIELSAGDVEPGPGTVLVTAEANELLDGSETEVEIEERPLNDQEHWEAAYERSIEYLDEALTVYGERAVYDGDDATIMHVLPSMEIEVEDVDNELNEADRWEDRAWDVQGRLDGDEFERTRELRRNIQIVRDLARCQVRFHGAFNTLDREWDIWDDEDSTRRDRPEQSDIESAATLHEEIEEILEDWDTVLDLIDDKVEQAEWQLEQLETMQDGVDLMWRATVPEVTTIDQVRLARQDFGNVEDELADPASAAPEDITDEKSRELAETWYEEAEEAERELV